MKYSGPAMVELVLRLDTPRSWRGWHRRVITWAAIFRQHIHQSLDRNCHSATANVDLTWTIPNRRSIEHQKSEGLYHDSATYKQLHQPACQHAQCRQNELVLLIITLVLRNNRPSFFANVSLQSYDCPPQRLRISVGSNPLPGSSEGRLRFAAFDRSRPS